MMSPQPKKRYHDNMNNTVIFLAVFFLLCNILSVKSIPQSNERDLFHFPGSTQNNGLNTQSITFESLEEQNLNSISHSNLRER